MLRFDNKIALQNARRNTSGGACEAQKERQPARPILPLAVRDSALGQIVGRKFNSHFVARHNTDEVLAHPARNVGIHDVAPLDFYAKPGICQRLGHNAFYFECFFFLFRHVGVQSAFYVICLLGGVGWKISRASSLRRQVVRRLWL